MPDFNDIVFSEEEEEELHLSPAEVRFFKQFSKKTLQECETALTSQYDCLESY